MRYYAEIQEVLTWAVYMEVPDNIVAEGDVAIRDYVYENYGEYEKDIIGGDEIEIVRLERYPEE